MTDVPAPPGRLAAGAAAQIDTSWWTVILLKPDCLARRLTGPVLAMVSQTVHVTVQRTVIPAARQILDHYANILPLSAEFGLDVAEALCRTYLGHPVTVALGYGPDAARRLRTALGPPDPAEAGAGTIRGHFGADSLARARSEGRLIENVIHSSHHASAVLPDLIRWFGPGTTTLLIPPTASRTAR